MPKLFEGVLSWATDLEPEARQQAKTLLDEHPDAYKSIDEVMANQSDLVRIDHTLHQVLNYKGV